MLPLDREIVFNVGVDVSEHRREEVIAEHQRFGGDRFAVLIALGRGPTRAKSYFEDDLVVCVLRGGFSRVEQTLLDGGRGAAVISQRVEFQEVMRERFDTVIEDATGRRVIGFMSGDQQHPDMMGEVVILAPTDLVDEIEVPVSKPLSNQGRAQSPFATNRG